MNCAKLSAKARWILMSWFDSAGLNSDVVIGTILTLTRNIEGCPFALSDSKALSDDARAEFIARLSDTLESGALSAFELASIDPAALSVLVKKGFADPDFTACDPPGTLLLDEEHGVSVMLGGKDQVKIRILLPGDSLSEALDQAFSLEARLDSHFRIAFSEKLGYLTSSPAFLGSAAKFSLLMHLPASGSDLSGSHFAAGSFTRMKKFPGDLCLITSDPFPGITEEEQIERLRLAESSLIIAERSARAGLRSDAPRLCDRVMRAYGILSNACLMPEDELMTYWSSLRLGAVIGLPELPSPEELGSILMAAIVCPSDNGNPDAARAALLKRRLSAFRNSCRDLSLSH